jgi:L-rhamnose-H+ transport protein
MCLIAGLLSVGFSFSFVYCQAPILEAMARRDAGPFVGGFAVWAISLTGAGILNSGYFALLMTKNRNWDVLFKHLPEAFLGTIFGVMFIAGFLFMGKGMLLLGALGASVGFGLQQSSQILGSQIVGFLSGEWKQADSTALRLAYSAIILLILAAVIMAVGNSMV